MEKSEEKRKSEAGQEGSMYEKGKGKRIVGRQKEEKKGERRRMK